MKNKIFLIISVWTVFTLCSFNTNEKLNFTYESRENFDNSIDVIVNIISGNPEFTYSLWTGAPWENGQEIENSGRTSSTTYTFRNINREPYYIVITDKDGLRRVKQIKIQAST